MCNLKNKTIILGVTGSIASYKAAEIASTLTKSGSAVITVMTESSKKFITPLTFESLTHQKVYTGLFEKHDYEPEHISLAERADLILIAPASANIIAKCANGIADDLLSCTILASKSPLFLAPAMNDCMYSNPATQDNIKKLKGYGAQFIGPQEGRLASGKSGLGRMSEISDITNAVSKNSKKISMSVDSKSSVENIINTFSKKNTAGPKIVITAGPTYEDIDDVRFIGNRSSGRMGLYLALAASRKTDNLLLINGPTSISIPENINQVKVRSAVDMMSAVEAAADWSDIVIMAAAVADYRPQKKFSGKIHKSDNSLSIELVRNPDILLTLKEKLKNKVTVGFSLDSTIDLKKARIKLENKSLNFIIANSVEAFNSDKTNAVIIDKVNHTEFKGTKSDLSELIIDRSLGLV